MKINSAANPQWADEAQTVINLTVDFDGIGSVPFTASPHDTEAHGRELYARAFGGEFGSILPVLPKPLSEVKATKRSEIVKNRNAAILGGFTYLGKTIDSDRDSVMAITGAAVAALAAKAASLPYSVIWTCADDSLLPLDADGVLGMAVTLAMFADSQHAKARPLKEAIAAETDPEKIKTVKW